MRTPRATAFGSFGYGWQQLWKYFLHLFLVTVIVTVLSTPAWGPFGGQHGFPSAGFAVLNLLSTAYWLLILPVIAYGANWLYLRYMRNENPNIADIFSGFKTSYLNIVLANLLVFAIVGIGLVLIIPGIIFGCRLSFVTYLVMDKGLDPVAAIEKSWSMTRGHGWRIFGMYVLSIPMVILGFALIIVGSLFAYMWVCTAFASLYHAVDLEDQAHLNQNGATA